MNKSSSPLLHLHLHLLHFFDNEQIFIFKKKKKDKIFKKGLGTRGIRLVLLRFLSKKKIINQKFQFHERIQNSQIFPKKKNKNHQSNFFSIPWKNSRFLNFSKKKIINQKFQFHEKIQDFQNFQKKKKEGNFQKRPWD